MALFAAALLVSFAATPMGFPDGLEMLEANAANAEQFVSDIRAYHNAELAAMALLQAELANTENRPTPERAKNIREELALRATRLGNVYMVALNHFPNNARLHNYYGELLYDTLGDSAEAIKQWNQALANDDDCDLAMNNLALHFIHVGRYDIGIKYMDEALKRDKKNPDYLFNMVQIYMVHFPEVEKLRKWKRSKVYKEAMKLSSQAVKYAPDDYDLLQDYAMNFFAAENFGEDPDWDDAAKAWEAARAKAHRQDETFNCWLNEGRVRLRNDDFSGAVRCLEEAVKLMPNSQIANELLHKAQEFATSHPEKGRKSKK
ncbi:MAG: tetratricopeptide repeat protein [Candidatus Hydrogenedens sp.]|nr:tetratricopeptide repeat protein [Candidatus Hydrogenedens sp.]